MSVAAFLDRARRAGWQVMAPAAAAEPGLHERAPEDLRLFLERCGGVRCGGGVAVAARIVHAQEDILGERQGSDPSAGWYVIAEDRLRASDGTPYWSGADLNLGDAYD